MDPQTITAIGATSTAFGPKVLLDRAQVFRTLVRGGRFVFSIEHPVITSKEKHAPRRPRS